METSTLQTVELVDYLVILAYMLTLVWIGKFFARYNKNIADFFKGGSKLPWWVGGISAFMAGFSAWMFTGGAGVVYERGPVGVLALCTGLLGTFFGFLLFAKRWRRTRVTSMFEYVSTRFNLGTQQALSWTFLPSNLFYCSTVLLATSIFVTAALGISEINLAAMGLPWDISLSAVQFTIVVSGIVILIYCYFGGLLAVTSADVLSFLIIIPMAVLIVPLILIKMGSFTQVFTTPPPLVLPEGKSILGEPITFFFVAMWLISNIHSYNTNPIVQRYWSVPDEHEARKVALLCTVLFVFGIAVWSIPPLAVRHMYPDLSKVWVNLKAPAEGAYVSACLSVLPHGLVGIMFAAIFAASMSSIDSTLNFVSGIFTNDIYRKTMHKTATEEQMLRVGRLSTLGLGIISILLALTMSSRGGAFTWMVLMDRIFTTPIVVPLLLGLFFPQRGSRAGLITFAITFAFNLIVTIFFNVEYSKLMFFSFILAYVVFNASAYLLPDTEDKKAEIRHFFRMLNTPVQVKEELGEVAIDQLSMLRFIGKLASATGLAICLMVFVSQPLPERMKVLIGGSVVLVLGLLMLWTDHRQRKR
jgi:solute:Na+ symporter, SSS family